MTVACREVGNYSDPSPEAGSSLEAAGSTSGKSATCRTLEHTAGATEICGQPKNVIVLGSNLLELILALEVQPAGFADRFPFHAGDYDDPAQQIPYLGQWVTSQPANVGLVFSPSLEAIAKAEPDLILGSTVNAAQYELLSAVAPTLLFEWFDTETNLRTVATAVGRPEQAEQLLAEMEQQVTAAQAEFTPVVAEHPNVLMLATDPQLAQLALIPGRFSFCSTLMTTLGFQFVHSPALPEDDLSQPVPISLETLPQLNEADLIILLGYNDQANQLADMDAFEQHQLKGLQPQWEGNAIAQSLDASQAGRVYSIPLYLCAGLPGPIGTELYLEELKQQLLGPN
ncbi:MAG: iron-siderophore ABC transporter substrate-binding protein [Leptolyngbya sp. SIOISBB]|nr:iron-siderophore ABC transporter substrate-binding protein [Leptolyngbya sp. SIOISBB]